MQGLLEVAGQRGMKAGTLMIAAGGLAVYQMTSLVLGPAGIRELHLSLAIPTVDADELSDASRPSANPVLGLSVATAAPSATVSRQALQRPAPSQPAVSAAPAAIVTTPPALAVSSEPVVKHGQGHRQPPKPHDGD